jgi:HdeA/HdeB family
MGKLFVPTSCLTAFVIGLLVTVAFAQNKINPIVDLKTLDCRTFLKLDSDHRNDVIMFYHGYISGQKNETVVNVDKLAQATDKVMDYCIDKPADTLMKSFISSR